MYNLFSTYGVDNQSHVDRTSNSAYMATDSAYTASDSTYLTTGSDCSNDDLYIDGDDDTFVFDIDANSCLQGLESNLNDFIGILFDNFPSWIKDLSVVLVIWHSKDNPWCAGSLMSLFGVSKKYVKKLSER